MPNQIMHPSLSQLLPLDKIPNEVEAIRDALASIFDSIFVKNLIASQSYDNSSGFYSLTLTTYNSIGINIPIAQDLRLVLNPTTAGTTEIPIAFDYSWLILKYINDFNLDSFDNSIQSILHILFELAEINEKTFLNEIINTFYPGLNAINDFLVQFNIAESSSITALNDPDSSFEEKLEHIIEQIANLDLDLLKFAYENLINVGDEGLERLKRLFQRYFDNIEENIKEAIQLNFNATIKDISVGLQFPQKWLQPVSIEDNNPVSGVLVNEPLPANYFSYLTFDVGSLVYSSKRGFIFNNVSSFNLNRSMIGKTGLIVSFSGLKIDLNKDKNIPEADADGRDVTFKGVYAENATITLPKKWFTNDDDPDTTLEIFGNKLLIGSQGGISGTIGLKSINSNNPITQTNYLWLKIGHIEGFKIGFNKFDITFKQNKVVHSELKAALEIKKFKNLTTGVPARIDVVGELSDNGNFSLTASFVPEYPITLPDVFTYKIRTLSLGKDESQDIFYIGTSGKLQFEGFLKDVLNIKEIDINRLRIYSDGSIEFEGGSVQLAKPIVLPLGPADFTVSAIHYGSHQKEVNGQMRKFNYFGFDGGISVDPLGIEVRGDGVKYYYCSDSLANPPKPYLHIQTLYVDLTVPASTPVAIINGWLSIPEPGVSPEYAGGIKLKLPQSKISGTAEMKLMPKYPAFIIDASFEFPVPIPLGTFAIYGFRGLIGYRYVAEREAIGLVSGVDSWYDYYTAPKRGINVRKFNGPDKTKASGTPFSVGAGASFGTSFDNGTVMNIKAMVLLSIPSMFMIDGQAAIISARLGLDDKGDPPFFAFVIVADNSVELGFGADFQMPSNDGGILDLYAKVDAAFYFNNSSKWHVNIGTKAIPVQTTVLSFLPLFSYVMLSAKGIEIGAGGGFNFQKDYGFASIHAWAQLKIGGKVSFERPQIGAYLYAGCGIAVNLCGIISFDMSLSVLFAVEAPHPFLIYGRINYSISIKLVFFRITYSGELEISWEFDSHKNTDPINPLISKKTEPLELGALNSMVKGVNMLTNEDFELKILTHEPVYDESPFEILNNLNNLDCIDILSNIIPLDTYIDIKTEKGLLPNQSISSIIGGYNAPAKNYVDLIPPAATIGDLATRQVKHQYVIEEVKLKFWDNSQWRDYNPYKALLKPDDLTQTEYNQIVNTLKIGQWQKTDGQYNTIRIMATTPFSYTEQGEPGWFIPEQFGHTSGSLFCEGAVIESKCADFTTKVLGQEYHTVNPFIPFFSNEVAFFHLIGSTTEFAKVVNEANAFNIAQSLYFRNNTGLQLILPQKSVRVELRLTTFSSNVTIQYFAIKPNTEALGYGTFYCNPDPNAANPDAPFEVIKAASELTIPVLYDHPTWKGVSKIVIIPNAPDLSELNLLTEQLAQAEEARFQSNLGLKPGYEKVKETQYVEVITDLTNKINQLVSRGCTKVVGSDPCSKDVALCSLYNVINDIFIKCFIDPTRNTIRDFSAMLRCSENIINLIREFDLKYPGHNLTALFENQIKDLTDFIKNPNFETYTFAWYGVQSILTILFENGDCDCNETPQKALAEPCRKDELFCDLYNQINEIFLNCFIDPRTKEIRDFKPMHTCANAIIKLIIDFDKLHPEYYLLEIFNTQITLINTFVNNSNLLNYLNAWHAVEFILNYLFTLGQCDCFPAGSTVTKCYTLFHNVCWLSVEDYEYNINIPSQAAIEADTLATVNGINKFGQPIWRPNTCYYLHFKLRDIVDGVSSPTSGLYPYTYGFTTAGPLGFYHKHPKATYGDVKIIGATNNNVPVASLTNKILRDTKGIVTEVGSDVAIPIADNTILKLANNSELKIDENYPLTPHIEKYPLTVLRQYIDYNRSYPNADGNLLGAKPLFYSDHDFTKISLYFSKIYASHFFQEWPAMLSSEGQIGLQAIKGKLKIVIKDPREGIGSQNPPSLDNIVTVSSVPQTIEAWDLDDNPLMATVINQYNNFTQNGLHCLLNPIEKIIPASKHLAVKIIGLKPSKLYTAIVNNVFDTNGDGIISLVSNGINQQKEIAEIHKFVFQTSRYKNFYEQVHSYKLKQTIDNVVSERDAIFDFSVDLEQYQKTAMLNTIKGELILANANEYDVGKINVLKQFQDPFDRIVEGILGLSPINAAISTEFNFIRNTNSIDSNKIIGLLIRNPEPFNNPKILRDQLTDAPAIPKGVTVDKTDFEILHSKDFSQILIMHNSTVFPSAISQLAVTFNYITWNGSYYEVVEDIVSPPAEPGIVLPEDYHNHSFTINLDLTN